MSALDLDDIKRRMEGSLNSLKTEFMGLRAGRASTAMLEPIMVEAYGSKMPMNQVGNISVPEPRLLTVTVWDAGLTSSVEKAKKELKDGKVYEEAPRRVGLDHIIQVKGRVDRTENKQDFLIDDLMNV